MKILISTFTYPPESNGVSHVVHTHAIGLTRRGHDVTIVTAFNKERRLKQVEKEGIKVVQFNIKGNGNIRIGYTGEIEKYKKFIAKFNADVMFFHCWQIWSTDLAIPVFHFNRAKKVLVSHGVSANSILSFKNVIHWLCWRPYVWRIPRMLKAFDHIIFLSTHKDRKRFYDYYLTTKMGLTNYSIIPNGPYLIRHYKNSIDFKKKYQINSRYVILQVADYNFNKNQKMTLKAFFESEVTNTTMVFIGDKENNYSIGLKKYVKKTGAINKVVILDNLTREEIIAAYLSADLFICSSFIEVQPLVILEAMNFGVPFISTNVGCISDLPGGLTVKNQIEMVQKIKMLINNESLRKRLGEEGRNICKKIYSWPVIIERYDELIKSIVKT